MNTAATVSRLSWMKFSELGVTAWAMGLVISGHMLPSGAVSADEPAPLVLPTEVPPTPAAPESEKATAPEQIAAPVIAPAPSPTNPDASAASSSSAKESETRLPTINPAVVSAQPVSESKYQFEGWSVTVRPAPRKAITQDTAFLPAVTMPSTQVKVPVNVQVNNSAPGFPLLWNIPNSTYMPWWQAPTSAYLFQRPQPYWQLRGDFYHLAPFINW